MPTLNAPLVGGPVIGASSTGVLYVDAAGVLTEGPAVGSVSLVGHTHDASAITSGTLTRPLSTTGNISASNLSLSGTSVTVSASSFNFVSTGGAIFFKAAAANPQLLFYGGSTEYARLGNTGALGIGATTFGAANKFTVNPNTTTDATAAAQINTGAAAHKGLVVQGVDGQSGNLIEVQSSDGTILASIAADGTVTGDGSGLSSLDASAIATGTLPVSRGGTGATTAAGARTALGLGTASTQNVPASGLVKSDGSALSAATAGTDYLTPTGSGTGLSGVVFVNGDQWVADQKTFLSKGGSPAVVVRKEDDTVSGSALTLVNASGVTSLAMQTWYAPSDYKASWIALSTDGPSGIGTGSPGGTIWVGYSPGNSYWFTDTVAGDICYRGSRLVFGNSGSYPGVLKIASSAVTCQAATTGTVPLNVQVATGQTANAQNWSNASGSAMASITKNGAFKPAILDDVSAPSGTLYYSTTQSKLVFKDSGGTVNPLY